MDLDQPNTDAVTDQASGSRQPSLLSALVFLSILAIIFAIFAVFISSQRSSTGPLVAEDMPAPIPVRVAIVQLAGSLTLDEKFTGLTTPSRTSMLGFQSGGRIDAIRADIGSKVRKGQTLAVLDTRSFQAQLAAFDAVVEEVRAGRDLAAMTMERQQKLLEKGHVAQQRVDEARAQVDSANARIESAQAQVDTMKVQIDLMRITAPFNGVITKRMADEGAIAAPGAPLLELVETGRMEARIGLPAKVAMRLKAGEIYKLDSDLGSVNATLRAVTGVIDSGTRTVTSVFEIAGDDLPAGSVVRLAIDSEVVERGVWVPLGALTEGNRGLWSVYVAADDGEDAWTARKRSVEIVHTEADRVFVRGAISNGDRLVLEGVTRLSPGMAVSPQTIELAETRK